MKHLLRLAIVAVTGAIASMPGAWAQSAGVPTVAEASTNADQVRAGTYTLDSSHGKITWSADHFGFSTYIGQFTDVAAKLTLDPKALASTSLTATVQAGSVGTFNALLDKNLKGPQWFNVARFPTLTFKSTAVQRTGANTANVTGNLTMMGVTKPVTLAVVFIQSGLDPMDKIYRIGFSATATLNRSEWGLNALIPLVGDTVHLTFEAELTATGP